VTVNYTLWTPTSGTKLVVRVKTVKAASIDKNVGILGLNAITLGPQ